MLPIDVFVVVLVSFTTLYLLGTLHDAFLGV
jgi:hypothetical protein